MVGAQPAARVTAHQDVVGGGGDGPVEPGGDSVFRVGGEAHVGEARANHVSHPGLV